MFFSMKSRKIAIAPESLEIFLKLFLNVKKSLIFDLVVCLLFGVISISPFSRMTSACASDLKGE